MQNQDNSELMRAYADHWMNNKREGMAIRNLDFRDDMWVSIDEWEEAMSLACPGGYNNFDAHAVVDALVTIFDSRAATDKLSFQCAREGSVACYISGPFEMLDKIMELKLALSADEASIDSGERLRLWWD